MVGMASLEPGPSTALRSAQDDSLVGNAKENEVGMTLAAVRKQLEGKKGKRYWRSIDEWLARRNLRRRWPRSFRTRRRSGSIRFRGAGS
jgi:hypothetical protein